MRTLTFQLPEKSFFSREELAERWGCKVDRIAHYIDDQRSLREAMRSCHLPPVSCIDAKPTTYISPNMWTNDIYGLVGPELTAAQRDCITDGTNLLPEFVYPLRAEAFTPKGAPDYERYFSVAEDFAGNRFRLVSYNDMFDLSYAAISAEYDRVIPLEEIQRFEKLNSQKEIINKHDSSAHQAAAESPRRSNLQAVSESSLIGSPYWQGLEHKAEQAITEFPGWKSNQRNVKRTGNLQTWLIETFGLTEREAEIIKKVLLDIFPDLQ